MNALPTPRFEQALASRAAVTQRRRFLDRLGGVMEQARAGGYRMAVLLVGLDRPCGAIASLEPEAAASLAARVAQRLECSAGEGAEGARLREDEFALLLPRMRTGAHVREVAARLLGTVRFPFRASIGIAIFPTDAQRPRLLLGRASVALALARREGRQSYSFYVPFFAATSAASSAPDL